jgi:hypothetical protein
MREPLSLTKRVRDDPSDQNFTSLPAAHIAFDSIWNLVKPGLRWAGENWFSELVVLIDPALKAVN